MRDTTSRAHFLFPFFFFSLSPPPPFFTIFIRYSACFYFLLSWIDTRAPGDVAAASAAVEADPTKNCERLCNRQKSPPPGALCCDSLWLPTILVRNINEFPQGRTQPSYITVTPEGVVTWRVEVRADLYTTLDLVAFPFDRQSLDVVLQILGRRGESAVRVVPSATGTKLFLAGTGDDLSRFTVTGIRIYAHEPSSWSEQFDDKKLKNLRTYSAWDDPAPVVPLPAGALLPNGSVSNVSAAPKYGADFTVTEVVVAVIISRNSLFDSLNIILPVVVCTCISLLTFFVEPEKLDTRLQIIITLFLSLVAIQFVVESELPSSSYVLPTRQLVIVSYLVLLLVCFEALVVYNVSSWERVFNWFQGMRRAKSARASLVAAQQRREEDKAAAAAEADGVRAASAAAAAAAAGTEEGESAAALGAFSASSSPRAVAEGGEQRGKNEAPKAAAAKGARSPTQQQLGPRPSLSSLSGSFARSFGLPRGSPWSWSGRKRQGSGPNASAAAAPSGGGRREAGRELGDVDDFALGGRGASEGSEGTIARARRRRQDIARQLDADARESWYAYVAWR